MPFSRPVYLITCDDTLLLVARPAGVRKHLRAALPRGGRFVGWTTPNRPTQCSPRRAGPRSLFDQPSARAFSAEEAQKAERFLTLSSIRQNSRSGEVMFTRTVRSAASDRATRKVTASLFSGVGHDRMHGARAGNSSPSSTRPLTESSSAS